MTDGFKTFLALASIMIAGVLALVFFIPSLGHSAKPFNRWLAYLDKHVKGFQAGNLSW